MDENTHELENRIERARDELGSNFRELEYKAKQMGDWRHHFSRHPFALLGVAFGGGVLLATMSGRTQARISSGETNPRRHKASDTWDHIQDALIGVATTRLTDFIGDLVPGFKQEFTGTGRADERSNSSPFLT